MKLDATTSRDGSRAAGGGRAVDLLALTLALSLALSLLLILAALAGPAGGVTAWLVGAASCNALALLAALAVLRQLRRANADRAEALGRFDSVLTEQRSTQAESTRALAEALQQRDRAEAASRAKDDFLALFDHELRNPLGAISSAVRVLQHERIGAEQSRNALDIITRQSGRLGQLLKDLLDAAQVVSGELPLARHAMDLAEAAERAATALRLDGALRHHELVMQLQAAWIDGDALRIEQVVKQALNDAFRRLPAGRRVLLEVGIDSAQAFLRVRDHDLATSTAEPPPVNAEPTHDTAHDTAHEAARASLGSTLAQRLVELQGGTTRLDAAGYEMRLPSIAPPLPTSTSNSRHPARSVALIQQGDEAAALQSLLARDGHAVSRHAEALVGLQAVVDQRPEVTIVDLALPGLGGFDLARRSRAAGYAGLMIAISSVHAQADAQRAMQAGFDAHLLQPVDAERLRELMRQHW